MPRGLQERSGTKKEPQMEPKCLPKRPQIDPKSRSKKERTQEAPKRHPRGPKRLQEASKRLQEASENDVYPLHDSGLHCCGRFCWGNWAAGPFQNKRRISIFGSRASERSSCGPISSKMSQEGPKELEEAPKRSMKPPRGRQEAKEAFQDATNVSQKKTSKRP